MRKLTVKNFSVIQDAELEFGKITVLIGPQSSGKSLLCKLANFLRQDVLELATGAILTRTPLEVLKGQVAHSFINRFLHGMSIDKQSECEFNEGDYSIKITSRAMNGPGTHNVVDCEFTAPFESLYKSFTDNPFEDGVRSASRKQEQDEIWTKLNLLLNNLFVYESLYIPDGRSFFVNPQKGFTAVQNTSLDPVILRFAPEIVWNMNWRVGRMVARDSALEELQKEMARIGQGEVVVKGDEPLFRRKQDRALLPLSLLSSGTSEILPIFNVLFRGACLQEEREAARSATRIPPCNPPIAASKQLVYVEEPEANIFPLTQNDMVRLFVWLANRESWNFDWVITTHSPYILSSFNNLIYAGQLGQNPELRSQIKIDPKYWVEPGTFRAYSIHDGKLESILSDTGLINGEYLDGVSDAIGSEFDSLLRLEYDHPKAS
jgi:energy-coupling factor transporter ATP-binding protein EcfA2